MKNLKKGIALLLTCAMAATLFAGCASKSKAVKSEIHFAINAAPDTLDLTKTTATIATTISLGSIYECLVALNEDYSIAPELAQSFTMSSDATQYTYVLRKGVKFHNGQEMKAADVVASMNRWIESFGTAKTMIGTARFTSTDDYTVVLKLDHAMPYLNELMATAAQRPIIVPKTSIDNADKATGNIKDFIGTGPYKLEKWEADRYIELTKFDDYQPYGTKGKSSGFAGYKEAKTATVYYDFVKDNSTRVAGIQSGEYDVAFNMPMDNYDQLSKSDYKVYKQLDGDLVMIYNKKQGIAANPLMRQAVNAALNEKDIMTAAYVKPDFFKLSSSYMSVPTSEWFTDAGKEFYNQNSPDKAKALAKQAGYNGETFRILVSSDYSDFYNAAVVIKQQLEAAGIKTELVVTDWATYLNYSPDPTKYDAFITSFSIKAIPSLILYLSNTWNGWATDPQLVDGIKQINTASNKDSAIATWKTLQQYCWSSYMPVSKLGDKYSYSVSTNKVQDLNCFQGPHAWNVVVSQ